MKELVLLPMPAIVALGAVVVVLAGVAVLLAVTVRRMSRETSAHVERMAVLMRSTNVGESVAAVERLRALDVADRPKVRASDQPVAPEKAPVLTRIWRRTPPKKSPVAGG